jgi:hypothetical protein
MQLFNAFNKLSNETSVVSGDLFFMEMSKFEVHNSFLLCGFVMACFFHHGEAKSLYELKIRQCGCFMHSTSFLMGPHLSLGTYFVEISKFEVQNSFLLCGFVMACFFHHGEAKSPS